MGTLIGQRDRVAVEFEVHDVEPELRKWIYGTMTLWAAGQPINRHSELASMTVALTAFPGVLNSAGDRSDPRLMALPANRVYDIVHGALYDDDEPVELTYHEATQLALHFERFQVSPSGFDVFDGWYICLVEDGLVGRLIWRTPKHTIHETRIGAGEFDRVIDQFLTELEKISGQTRAKYDR